MYLLDNFGTGLYYDFFASNVRNSKPLNKHHCTLRHRMTSWERKRDLRRWSRSRRSRRRVCRFPHSRVPAAAQSCRDLQWRHIYKLLLKFRTQQSCNAKALLIRISKSHGWTLNTCTWLVQHCDYMSSSSYSWGSIRGDVTYHHTLRWRGTQARPLHPPSSGCCWCRRGRLAPPVSQVIAMYVGQSSNSDGNPLPLWRSLSNLKFSVKSRVTTLATNFVWEI